MSVNASNLHGRRVIYTDCAAVDESNVLDVLQETIGIHRQNSSEIQYLYNYYKGIQPILKKTKEVRPEINNKIVENRANEIVSFKVAYTFGEAVQYVNRSGDDTKSDAINMLNEFVFAEDKESKDKELAEWFNVCGTAYRMVMPDARNEEDESPFEIYTLDPRYTYVVYHTGLGNKPVCAVKYVDSIDRDGAYRISNRASEIYSVYTANDYFEIVDGIIVKHEKHTLGDIPIVEYPLNNARLGAFEIVLPLLDGINEIQSARIDSTEQFVQALMMFKGVDLDAEDFSKLKDMGGFSIPADGDCEYLVQELNQAQTQTVVDYLYNTVLTICGMPSQADGNTADSSNNGAVILKNGWQGAESRAKDTELMFKKSEKRFLKIALKIARTLKDIDIKLSDIEIRFTRRNYENITEKANVLMLLLSSDKVHPRLAFEHSGLFVDPEVAYTMSKLYYDEKQAELEKTLTALPVESEETDAEPADD